MTVNWHNSVHTYIIKNEVPDDGEYITAWCEMVHSCTDSAKSPLETETYH